jgi:hypothetical protein
MSLWGLFALRCRLSNFFHLHCSKDNSARLDSIHLSCWKKTREEPQPMQPSLAVGLCATVRKIKMRRRLT